MNGLIFLYIVTIITIVCGAPADLVNETSAMEFTSKPQEARTEIPLVINTRPPIIRTDPQKKFIVQSHAEAKINVSDLMNVEPEIKSSGEKKDGADVNKQHADGHHQKQHENHETVSQHHNEDENNPSSQGHQHISHDDHKKHSSHHPERAGQAQEEAIKKIFQTKKQISGTQDSEHITSGTITHIKPELQEEVKHKHALQGTNEQEKARHGNNNSKLEANQEVIKPDHINTHTNVHHEYQPTHTTVKHIHHHDHPKMIHHHHEEHVPIKHQHNHHFIVHHDHKHKVFLQDKEHIPVYHHRKEHHYDTHSHYHYHDHDDDDDDDDDDSCSYDDHYDDHSY